MATFRKDYVIYKKKASCLKNKTPSYSTYQVLSTQGITLEKVS